MKQLENLYAYCQQWIEKYFASNQCKNVVIGISSGKDSTIAAAFCKNALGSEHVY